MRPTVPGFENLSTSPWRFVLLFLGLTLAARPLCGLGAWPAGHYVFMAMVGFFLLARRHRPWRRLGSLQRGLSFLAGLGLVVLLSVNWDLTEPSTVGGAACGWGKAIPSGVGPCISAVPRCPCSAWSTGISSTPRS